MAEVESYGAPVDAPGKQVKSRAASPDDTMNLSQLNLSQRVVRTLTAIRLLLALWPVASVAAPSISPEISLCSP